MLPAAGLGGSQAFPAEKVAAAKLNTDVEPPKPTQTKSAAAKPKAAATTFDPAAFHAVALACDAAMVSAAAAAASEDGRSHQAQDRPGAPCRRQDGAPGVRQDGAPCGRQDGARRELGSTRSVHLVAHQVRVRVKGSGSR